MNIKIGDIVDTEKNHSNFYLYAETAFTHEGDKSYLLKQIESAKRSGCDGVKFQVLINPDSCYRPDIPVYKKLGKWIFSASHWRTIIEFAKNKGLEVIVLPIDLEAACLCGKLHSFIDAIEIHSINLNEYFILREIQKTKRTTVLISAGGALSYELDYAIKSISPYHRKALMFGYQAYPTDYHKINLLKIKERQASYKIPVGYADHTGFDIVDCNRVCEYAYLLGARIFETHIILKKGQKRIDYEAARDVNGIRSLRKSLDNLVKILGSSRSNNLSEEEKTYRNRAKQLVWVTDLSSDQKIGTEHLTYKVCPEMSDYRQGDIETLIGKRTGRKVKKNSVVKKVDVKS